MKRAPFSLLALARYDGPVRSASKRPLPGADREREIRSASAQPMLL